MNGNRSVATIDAPQFINLQQDAINPGISKCEIKVMYLGKNRNGSYITKDVAIQMANSLPGTPIVGAFREDIDDFGDHGHIMHIEDGEIEFSCKTIPYGFVAPDAQVWFQNFTDTDEFGNDTQREYLMTTGFLWTGQYPEVAQCITEGKGQSMELDSEKMEGHWATDNNEGIEFFIINDAIFTKLCILGDDVEPCFEGAAVTSPEVSKNFSKDSEFSRTLYAMLNELKFALKTEGGSSMSQVEHQLEETVEEAVESVEFEQTEETSTEEAVEVTEVEEGIEEEFACGDGKKKKYEKEDEKDPDDDTSDEADPKEEDDDDKKKQSEHSLNISAEEFELMKQELAELKAYKLEQENAKKDALINKYFMLDETDKADVIAHKEEYSLGEIEAKLALAYVKKNVDFSTIDGKTEMVEEEEVEDDPITTFSLDSEAAGIVSPLVARLRESR